MQIEKKMLICVAYILTLKKHVDKQHKVNVFPLKMDGFHKNGIEF